MSARRVPRLLLACAVACLCGGWQLAQATIAQDERGRIEWERAQLQANLQAQEARCFGMFAVEDCLSDARRNYRRQLQGLKARERALTAQERQQKAAERLRLQSGKAPTSSVASSDGQWGRIRDERASQAAIEEDLSARNVVEVRVSSTKAPLSPPMRSAARVSSGAAGNAALAADKAQFAQKQRQAKERRAIRDKRLAQVAPGASKPLPAAD